MDPRRRLQVLNQSNPSLRVSVAPASNPELKVTSAPTQDLRVGNEVIKNTTSTGPSYTPPPAPKPFNNGALNFLNAAGEKFGGGLARDLVAIPSTAAKILLKPTTDAFVWNHQDRDATRAAIDRFINGTKTLNEEGFMKDDPNVIAASEAGAKAGSILKGTADVAQLAAGAIEAPEALANLANKIAPEGRIASTLAKIPWVKNPVADIRTAAEAGDWVKTVNKIAEESNPKTISKALNVSEDTAKYLAAEKNPAAIRAVLADSAAQGGEGVMPVYTAMNPDPRSIPEGYHVPGAVDEAAQFADDEARAANAGQGQNSKNKPQVTEAPKTGNTFTTDSGVKAVADPKLVDEGLITGDIKQTKIKNLVPGADVNITEAADPKTVAQYIDDISNGKPIEPVIVERGPNGELLVKDGRHRLAAMEALGLDDVPVTEVPTPKALPEKASGPIAGDGFTMADKSNPELSKVSSQLQKIESKLEKVRSGKSNLSGDEVRQLIAERDSLITKATTAGSGTSEVATAAKTKATAAPAEVGEAVNKTADTASQAATDAKVAFPDADPETQKAIQEVMDQLGSAESEYKKADKIRSAEKGQRIGAGSGAFESVGGGEAGMKAKLAQLRGSYTESGFSPIDVSPETQTAILNNIEASTDLKDFQKLNTQQAIRKIWGTVDAKPTPSDVRYIRNYFGDGLADQVQEAIKVSESTGEKFGDTIAAVAGIPRALMATGDLSFGLRQGLVLGTRYPAEWARANAMGARFAVDPEYFQKSMNAIKEAEDAKGVKIFDLMKDKMKIDLNAAVGDTEEAFSNSNKILESKALKKAGIGHVVEGSDRAFSGSAAQFRSDVARKIIDQYGGADEVLKNWTDKDMESLGKMINTATGRGSGKDGGAFEKAVPTLSKTLFSPRLWKSRLDVLNPAYYAKLSGPAQKIALQNAGSLATVAGIVLAAATAVGAEVETDARSSDFLKIKTGNTRYDVLGGLQQNLVFAWREISGQKKNSETGEVSDLNSSKPFGADRASIAGDLLLNKADPAIAASLRIAHGKDRGGHEVNPAGEIAKLFIPLNAQGVYETTKDTGSLAKGIALNAPATFGVGVQTYGTTPTKDQGKPNADRAKSLDERIKLDGDAANKTVDEFKKALSKDEQSLLNASDKERKALVKDGTITQDDYDHVKAIEKAISNLKGENEVPEEIKSKVGQAFYKKYNSLTEEGKKKYLADTPDETAKEIAVAINKERSNGLDEYKPSNELSKAYAEYEKDIQGHPEYSEVDKRNKAKAFQSFAYKLNFSSNQRDVFNEGSSSDLRALIDAKSISKEDLDAAIKLDNDLYNSGLTGTLKFSKKFRNEFGYAIPNGGTGPNAGSGGSGGSGSDTKRAYLSDLLPPAKSGGTKAIPQFSARSRTKVSPPVKVGGGTGKKISIKL